MQNYLQNMYISVRYDFKNMQYQQFIKFICQFTLIRIILRVTIVTCDFLQR